MSLTKLALIGCEIGLGISRLSLLPFEIAQPSERRLCTLIIEMSASQEGGYADG